MHHRCRPLLNVANSRHSNHAAERKKKKSKKKQFKKRGKEKKVYWNMRNKKHTTVVASGQLSRAYRILLSTVHLQKDTYVCYAMARVHRTTEPKWRRATAIMWKILCTVQWVNGTSENNIIVFFCFMYIIFQTTEFFSSPIDKRSFAYHSTWALSIEHTHTRTSDVFSVQSMHVLIHL